MNGKINWPMSTAPNTYPELGYFYVWVDTDKNLKAMDSDGNIQNLSARYFEDLLDLNISNLQDGQYLIYNSTSGKWENDFTDLEDLETLVGEIEAELLTLTSDFDILLTMSTTMTFVFLKTHLVLQSIQLTLLATLIILLPIHQD